MTGAYLRVKRDGRWESVEIEWLTNKEREEAMKGRTPEELIRWINMLCNETVEQEISPYISGDVVLSAEDEEAMEKTRPYLLAKIKEILNEP